MKTDFHFDPETAAANILFLIESVLKRFDRNDAAVSRYDNERGDLDHLVELTTFNAAEGYKLVRRIRENRRERRICKDENLVMKPLHEFIHLNGDKILKEIKGIVKETEKKAVYRDAQKYHPRTNLISAEEFEQKRVKA